MKYNWIADWGKFDITKEKIIFKGSTTTYTEQTGEKASGATAGTLLCNEKFSEGSIKATIEFIRVDEKSSCEIIFNFNPITKNFYSAGISPSPTMFNIRSFINGKWDAFSFSGLHENLKAKQKYSLEVILRGSRVILLVDEVEITSCILPTPLVQSQIGLFFLSTSDVVIHSFDVKTEKPKAFVIMEFTDDYNELYNEVIKTICEKDFELTAVRADEIYGPGIIIADIAKQINESKIVIAEITPLNANVFYELGYAHALNKPTILIAQKNTKLPFDISSFRTLFYENSIAGKNKISSGLRKHLSSILNY